MGVFDRMKRVKKTVLETASRSKTYKILIPNYEDRVVDEYVRTDYMGRFNTLDDLRKVGTHTVFSQSDIFDIKTDGIIDKTAPDYNDKLKIGLDEDTNVVYDTEYEAQILKEEDEIETMYFNHFVKVYPICDGSEVLDEGGMVGVTKMYCDCLELMQYGDSVPYIVSYDRKGVRGKDVYGHEGFEDLDCSVFARIMSYNPNTHLLVVNNVIWFENENTPKYVVVAYQNLSPFMRPQKLTIITPNEGVKKTVEPLIEEFKNGLCDIEMYSEDEYEFIVEDREYLSKKETWGIRKASLLKQMNTAPNRYSQFGIWGVFNKTLLADGEIYVEFKINPTENCTYSAIVGTLMEQSGNTYVVKAYKKGNTFQAALGTNNYAAHASYPTSSEYKSATITTGKSAVVAMTFAGLSLKGDINGMFADMPKFEVINNFSFGDVSAYRQMVRNCPSLIHFGNDGCKFKGKVNGASDTVFDLFKGLGNIETIDTSDLEYYIPEDTTSTIRISMKDAFKDCTSLSKLKLSFNTKNKMAVTNLDNAFENCVRLEEIDLTFFDFSQLTSAKNAFKGCKRLKRIIVNWGTNTVVTNLSGMFDGCKSLTDYGTMNLWTAANVNIRDMFKDCVSLKTLNINNFDTDSISGVFDNCGAEKISFVFKRTLGGDSANLNMPNLREIVNCGSLVSTVNCDNSANYQPFVINAPNLDRASWLRFVEKQNFRDYAAGAVYLVMNVNREIISRLVMGTDLIRYENDDFYIIPNYNVKIYEY